MSKTTKNKKNPEKNEKQESEKKKDVKTPLNSGSLLQEEVKRLQEELKEEKSKYLHLLADSENSRKRMQKEKSDSNKFAISHVMTEFIQPIDNFENALNCADNMSDEVKNWAIGFKMILEQLKASLANQGIQSFVSLGKTFDPHFHEAMETLEDEEQPEDLIVKEFVKGYKMHDRVIRPAKVKVVKRPVKEVTKEVETSEDKVSEINETDENTKN
jgi:molecular chaperone GrpE